MKVIGLAGWSGSGKTTLLSRLVPHLVAEGLKISTIKHAHHKFDLDTPGKDSWTHRQAGATEVLISSERRWALMHELRGEPELTLRELLPKLSPVDLVIVEGFKTTTPRKIEVHRIANGKPLLYPDDPAVVAIATDGPLTHGLPAVHLDDVAGVAALVRKYALPLDDVLAREALGT
jgi:molybdopterin-guanine dinucleotide biosynthesis protein B